MKVRFVLLSLIAIASSAIAAEPPMQHYVYGMPLDIDRVISIEEPADICGVVTARMTYEDSHGVLRVLDYSKWSRSCVFGGGI